MPKRTLENLINYFSEHELRDLCYCINFYGDRKNGSLRAFPSNVKYYIKSYAEKSVRNALESGELSVDAQKFINKLKDKLERL